MEVALALVVTGLFGVVVGMTLTEIQRPTVEEVKEKVNKILPKRASKRVRRELVNYICSLLQIKE